MPELPEVQTIVDDLNKKIKGDTIVGFWSDWKKAIKNESFSHFQKEINRRKILKIYRRGKNIFLDLSGSKTLYIHLKMTGHLLVKPRVNLKLKIKKDSNQEKNYFNEKVNQYIHHIFYLVKDLSIIKKNKVKVFDKTLEFSDLRKFGKIVLGDTDKIQELAEIKKLGVDALSSEFTKERWREILRRRKNKSIGLVLMEQELLAGIGNIYRSEILFEAGVHPKRKIEKLTELEKDKIFFQIGKVLRKAIKLRGTSDSDYRDTNGAPGGFQKVLKVYRRDGKKCKKCDTIIKRIKLGQRSAFYCPVCQK